MKYLFLLLLILFSSCSLIMSDPNLIPETEKIIVEVTQDIIKKESK